MTVVLFGDDDHLLLGRVDTVGSGEEDPAEDQSSSGKVIREQRFSKIKMRKNNGKDHRNGRKERNSGNGETFDGLVDTESGDES